LKDTIAQQNRHGAKVAMKTPMQRISVFVIAEKQFTALVNVLKVIGKDIRVNVGHITGNWVREKLTIHNTSWCRRENAMYMIKQIALEEQISREPCTSFFLFTLSLLSLTLQVAPCHTTT
jgi:hypothetical protein